MQKKLSISRKKGLRTKVRPDEKISILTPFINGISKKHFMSAIRAFGGDARFMIEHLLQRIRNIEESFRIGVMAGFLVCAALMTFWFHGVLGSGAVFTHLFYIPIIFASIWWQRKGVWVALFLAAILVASHLINRMPIVSYNDYLRSGIFIAVSLLVARLSEKIRKRERALRESEARCRGIFNNAEVGIFRNTISDGTILEANQRLASILGFESREELMRTYKASECYVNPGLRVLVLDAAGKTGRFDQREIAIRDKNGSVVWAHVSGRVCTEAGFVEGIMVDVTQEKMAKDCLKESEANYRAVFNGVNDLIAVCDGETGRVIELNDNVFGMFGYEWKEIRGCELKVLSAREAACVPGGLARFKRAAAGETQAFEWIFKAKDGRKIWTEITLSHIAAGGEDRVLMVVRDIDNRKRAENALMRMNQRLIQEGKKRRHLSERLIDLIERDRKQISMDLHDQIGQDLTRLKMDLEMAISKIGPEGLERRDWSVNLTAARDKAVKAIMDVKEISSGLRPSVLDHLGLAPALKELCDIMRKQALLHIDFFTQKRVWMLGPEKDVAIYRIVQEALTNMVRHSDAKRGFVSLTMKDAIILVSVEDDGAGFELDTLQGFDVSRGGFGLLIMEERARQLGGSLRVESRVGDGTTVLAEIPV